MQDHTHLPTDPSGVGDEPTDIGDEPTTTRRNLLRGAAAIGTAAVLGEALTGRATAQSGFDGWFDNVSNYDGVVDKTDKSEVTVTVGAEANGGGFGFGPAAVRVDPGTKAIWKWTGKGGSHNVVAQDGAYESEMVGESGHTFSHTFDSKGVSKYYCMPHKSMGMKGAVYVDESAKAVDKMQAPEPDSNPGGTEVTLGELAIVGSVVAGLLSPLAFGAFLGVTGDGSEDQRGHRPE